VVRAE